MHTTRDRIRYLRTKSFNGKSASALSGKVNTGTGPSGIKKKTNNINIRYCGEGAVNAISKRAQERHTKLRKF